VVATRVPLERCPVNDQKRLVDRQPKIAMFSDAKIDRYDVGRDPISSKQPLRRSHVQRCSLLWRVLARKTSHKLICKARCHQLKTIKPTKVKRDDMIEHHFSEFLKLLNWSLRRKPRMTEYEEHTEP
jgi:hypothetical protein